MSAHRAGFMRDPGRWLLPGIALVAVVIIIASIYLALRLFNAENPVPDYSPVPSLTVTTSPQP